MKKETKRRPVAGSGVILSFSRQATLFQALTRGDDNGVIVADARRLSIRALAVIASIAVEEEQTGEGLLDLVTRGEQLHVRNIELGGRTHFLSAVGQAGYRVRGRRALRQSFARSGH